MIQMNLFSDKEKEIMEEKEIVMLEECPICRGAGMIMHEGGWNVQVECADCGSHTVYLDYENEAQKAEAVAGVVRLWNLGKVIKQNLGE